jgi:DNA topoisomerase-2
MQGTIERLAGDKFKIAGIVNKLDNNTVEITELPVRKWTQDYKEMLEEWVNGTDKTPACVKV